jgi:hypothetical protein
MAERADEDAARRLADEVRKLRVEDVAAQMLVTISSLAYQRLGVTAQTSAARDLDQVRLAIATIDAVAPLLEPHVPDQLVRDLRTSSTHLKLSYADAARAAEAGQGGEDDAGP